MTEQPPGGACQAKEAGRSWHGNSKGGKNTIQIRFNKINAADTPSRHEKLAQGSSVWCSGPSMSCLTGPSARLALNCHVAAVRSTHPPQCRPVDAAAADALLRGVSERLYMRPSIYVH
jgi:hypothetical protein